jgi:hypothetical protein
MCETLKQNFFTFQDSPGVNAQFIHNKFHSIRTSRGPYTYAYI